MPKILNWLKYYRASLIDGSRGERNSIFPDSLQRNESILKSISDSIDDNDFDNDLAEMTPQAAAGLLLSNHSYGIPAGNVDVSFLGAYSGDAIWAMMVYWMFRILFTSKGAKVGFLMADENETLK